MDRIGVAIIGCGFSATVFHAPFLLNSDRFVIRCVVTSKQECEVKRLLGIEVPCFSSLDEALRSKIHQFSLVVVTSPNNSHFSFAMQCLQNRLWVVVEKPLTTTLQEAEMLCSAANSERLACFQNRKFDSDFLTVKREIDSGVLGRVVHLRSEWRRYRPEVKPGWRWSCAGPGTGLLFDLGPHMVHQAMLLFKAMPSTVSCIMALQRDGAVVDDFFAVTLQFANEPALVVQMEASYLNCSSEFGERSWLVYGEKGCFEKRMGIDAQEQQLKDGMRPGSPEFGVEPPCHSGMRTLAGCSPVAVRSLPGNYNLFYEEMEKAIDGKGQAPVSINEARNVMRVIVGAIESHQKGIRVSLVQ